MVRWVGVVGLLVSTAFASPAHADEPPPEGPEGRVMQAPEPPPEAEEEERGLDLVIPVGRLGWGTAQSVQPGNVGGFAFDLAVGGRLLFQDLGEGDAATAERWRPSLTGELGYSRQAGDYGTHDLTVGLGFGFQTLYVGLHLFETVTFGVSGDGRYGLRSTVRLETLMGLFFLDVGHVATFAGGTTAHDIRGVIGVDVGLLISLFVITGLLH